MSHVYTVYQTTNLTNGKFYVGVHMAPENDPLDIKYLGSGILLRKAIKAHGESNFEKTIIGIFDTAVDAFELEEMIVDEEYLTRSDVYNLTTGGCGGNTGSTFNWDCPEFRKAHALGHSRRVQDPEIMRRHRFIMNEVHNRKSWKDAQKEAGAKRSKSKKWRDAYDNATVNNPAYVKEQACRVRSTVKTQLWKTNHAEGQRRKAQNPEWQNQHKKMMEKRNACGEWRSKIIEHNRKKRKRVEANGVEYESCAKAAEAFGISVTTVGRRAKRETNGFRFI